jgi:hypothetical protein
MSLLIASSLMIPLTFGGLSTRSPVYQRAIAIGNFAGQLAGQQAQSAENSCMSGTPVSLAQHGQAQAAAHKMITRYWQHASNKAPDQLPPLFTADGRINRNDGTQTISIPLDVRLLDPFATTGAMLLPAPVSFTIAGDGRSAIGQWEVHEANGQLRGTYVASFKGKGDTWLISALEAVSPHLFVEPLVRYCHTPGDIIEHLMVNAKTSVELAEKELAERLEKEKAARGTAKQESAQRKAFEAKVALESARRSADQAIAKIVAIQQTRSARQAAFKASRR